MAELRRDDDGRFIQSKTTEYALIISDPVIREWLDTYQGKTKTDKAYAINQLQKFTSMSGEELRTLEKKQAKTYIKNLLGSKIAEGKPGAVLGLYRAANGFFEYYDNKLDWKRNEKVRVGTVKTEYVPKSPEVWAIAEASSAASTPPGPRNKTLILTDWMTGLRENAICTMRYGAIAGYNEDDCPIAIRVGNEFQTIGNGVWVIDDKISGYGLNYFYTFLPKLAFLEIQEYLSWLTKRGTFSKEPKEYLFKAIEGKTFRENITWNACWNAYKLGLKFTTIDPATSTFHKLRDAFKSVLIKAEIDSEVREAMMAHVPEGSKGNYFDYHDIDMIRKEYMKADWSRTGLHRVDKIEKENMELRARVAQLERQEAASRDVSQRLSYIERYVYGNMTGKPNPPTEK